MPREKIGDPDTEDLYVQVNWRQHDEEPNPAMRYVQVSTHNERQDRESIRLLNEAGNLISFLVSVVRSGEVLSADDEERIAQWRTRVLTMTPELAAVYVTLNPKLVRQFVRIIHKANRQAFTTEDRADSMATLR